MDQENKPNFAMNLDSPCPAGHQLTPQVDKAVSLLGLVGKERKLFKNQAKNSKRRIQELEANLADSEQKAYAIQLMLKKRISMITKSRDAVREQLASALLTQESLERDKSMLRAALIKLQSTTTALWEDIPDILVRTGHAPTEHENPDKSELELSMKEELEENPSSMLSPQLKKQPAFDESLDSSMVYFSPEGR
ncbi:uncharacterized protein LOC135163749 [Diachasmimorpha longicaudata]|uniref:uncharacterized protein LOC135163749 n=1 Tax=Diachasmimorpha longicaudata TaxID=58733 RepID=UPI0030B86A6C